MLVETAVEVGDEEMVLFEASSVTVEMDDSDGCKDEDDDNVSVFEDDDELSIPDEEEGSTSGESLDIEVGATYSETAAIESDAEAVVVVEVVASEANKEDEVVPITSSLTIDATSALVDRDVLVGESVCPLVDVERDGKDDEVIDVKELGVCDTTTSSKEEEDKAEEEKSSL